MSVEISHAGCYKSAGFENDSKGTKEEEGEHAHTACNNKTPIAETPTDWYPSSFLAPQQWLPVQQNIWCYVVTPPAVAALISTPVSCSQITILIHSVLCMPSVRDT